MVLFQFYLNLLINQKTYKENNEQRIDDHYHAKKYE
jgi:hypothetical protein